MGYNALYASFRINYSAFYALRFYSMVDTKLSRRIYFALNIKIMKNNLKATIIGFLASLLLLLIYFSVLTFVSGWNFAKVQFLTTGIL